MKILGIQPIDFKNGDKHIKGTQFFVGHSIDYGYSVKKYFTSKTPDDFGYSIQQLLDSDVDIYFNEYGKIAYIITL